MEIVVEIIHSGQRDARIEKLDTKELRIGRAWSSDILVTDPDVDAEHLLVQFDDDAESFSLIDLQSANGSRHNKKKFEGQTQADFGDLIQIGQTRLRIHRLHDPVPATKQRSLLDHQLAHLYRPAVALGLGASAILLQMLDMYLSSSRDLEWHTALTSLIGMTTGLAFFALLLAGLSKLFRQEFVYWPNLGLAASLIILQKLVSLIINWISFNTLSEGLEDFISNITRAGLLALWLIPGLHICTPLKPWIRNTVTAVLVCITLATSYILPSFREDLWQSSRPQLVTGSMPASLLLTPGTPRQEYLDLIRNTFAEADQLAIEAREEKAEESTEPE